MNKAFLLICLSAFTLFGCIYSQQKPELITSINLTRASCPTTTFTPLSQDITYNPLFKSFNDPLVAAVGDIACSSKDPNYEEDGDPNGNQSTCKQKETADLASNYNLSAILAVGDILYYKGNHSEEYNTSFAESWGRFKPIIHPVPGNHEYDADNATGYFNYFGSAAGEPSKGYYSFNIGKWHIIALNSECEKVGGCRLGSPEETWLRNDLAKGNYNLTCLLAFWHRPLFSSGYHGGDDSFKVWWQDLYKAGADVVINGHDHDYERLIALTPEGKVDPDTGIREFVVGTGGKSLREFYSFNPSSLAKNSESYGILLLKLHPNSYEWKFASVDGNYTETGRRFCHGAPVSIG